MLNCHGSSAYTDYDSKKKSQDNLNKIMTGTNAAIAVISEIPAQYGGTPGKIFSAVFKVVNNQITFSAKNSDDLNGNQVAYFEKLATDILVGAAIGTLALAALPALGEGALAVAAAGALAIISDYASDLVYPIYQDVKDALANNRNYNQIDPHDTRRCHPDPRQQIKPILQPPTNPNDPRRSDPKSNTYRIAWIIDPLVLDLDGDGIETVAASSGVLFDHNADGIQTTSGWVKPDDGLLVRDINGNGLIDTGRELFGDSTLLANNTTAANGFAALTDLDSNADGVIDAADAAFGELKVWQDVNQDGISQAGELKTLAELGITALNLTRTSSNITLPGGTQTLAGSYTKADGSGAVLADLNLTQDTFNTQYTNNIEVPEELQNLPDLPGMGRLRSLQEAADNYAAAARRAA